MISISVSAAVVTLVVFIVGLLCGCVVSGIAMFNLIFDDRWELGFGDGWLAAYEKANANANGETK